MRLEPYEGNDEKVLSPVIEALSKESDAVIFAFHDQMAELLYALDTKKLAFDCFKVISYKSDDSFLYSRCVALINGPAYYKKVKAGKESGLWNMEFESLLYIPKKAFALKHQSSAAAYPHFTPLSFETGSNQKGWE